jgi:hypothetical protein
VQSILSVIGSVTVREPGPESGREEVKEALDRCYSRYRGGTSPSKEEITGGLTEAERNKLVFFKGAVYTLDLEDLLRASAEVLEKGSVGHRTTRAGSMHFGALGKTLKWGLKKIFLSNFFLKVTIFFLKKKKIKYVFPLLSQIMQSFQLEKS